jgi:RimJ/RimL family protein N-acetyltransferase/aryl carrier-like protein
MTAVEERTRRDAYRHELAALLELDPAVLGDTTRVTDELGLDSLGMMRLLAWLESHGVLIDHSGRRTSVGELLTLLERASAPGLSVRVTGAPELGPGGRNTGPGAPTDIPAGPRLPVDPLAPELATHAMSLTPVQPDDLGFLYGIAVDPDTSYRWRYRGAPPSIERFAENLWKQVTVQFVARRTADRHPVGHLVAFASDPGTLHAHVGAVFIPEYTGTGLAAQAVAMFVRYLFRTFPFRKLYMDIPGFNWPQVSSGEGRLFQVEGILRGHNYYAGRYWDEYVCAIYADQFREGGDTT